MLIHFSALSIKSTKPTGLQKITGVTQTLKSTPASNLEPPVQLTRMSCHVAKNQKETVPLYIVPSPDSHTGSYLGENQINTEYVKTGGV